MDLTTSRPAIVLLSGGLDSATVLAMAKAHGYIVHALSFRYGQRHVVELEHAYAVAQHGGVASHHVIDVDLRAFGGSALTADIAVPKSRDVVTMSQGVPVTYVPARNTLFLSYALALAEVKGARDLVFGANAIDYSGYPDCRPAFVSAFEHLANVATKIGIEAQSDDERLRVHAPLMHLGKADIIRAGTALGVDYALTWSCYDPQPSDDDVNPRMRACGACDSCVLRHQGFVDAGVPDPTPYVR